MDMDKFLSFDEWKVLTQRQKEAMYGIPKDTYYQFMAKYITDWDTTKSLGYTGYCNWFRTNTPLMNALKEDDEL